MPGAAALALGTSQCNQITGPPPPRALRQMPFTLRLLPPCLPECPGAQSLLAPSFTQAGPLRPLSGTSCRAPGSLLGEALVAFVT